MHWVLTTHTQAAARGAACCVVEQGYALVFMVRGFPACKNLIVQPDGGAYEGPFVCTCRYKGKPIPDGGWGDRRLTNRDF